MQKPSVKKTKRFFKRKSSTNKSALKTVTVKPAAPRVKIDSSLLKIGEASKALGVSIDTLRRWEKAGKIESLRTPGGTRLYSLELLRKINPISTEPNPLSTEELLKKIDNQEQNISINTNFVGAGLVPALSDGQPQGIAPTVVSKFINRFLIGSAMFLVLTLLLTSWIAASYLTAPKETAQFFKHNIASGILRPFHFLAEETIAVIDPKKARELGFALDEDPPPLSDNQLAALDPNVLAVTASSPFLEVNATTQINGSLFVRDLINGLSLEATSSAGTMAFISGDTTLTVTKTAKLDQDVSTTSAPSFTSLTLSSSTNQLASGGINFTLPATTTTLIGKDTTDTLTNKSLSGSSNTFTSIPNSALSNNKVTVTAGTNLSGGGDVELGNSITLALASSPAVSGVLKLADGTAAAPSLTFTNDLDSGLYRLDADSIGLIVGGDETQGITIDASGNVGVGTITPTFQLETTGNVGIGTSLTVTSAGIFGSLQSGSLSVSGNTGIGSSLNVSSAAIFNSLSVLKSISGATLGISGNSNLATVYTSGNIGIGATSAAYNLDVWGTGRITGALTVGGNIGVGTSINVTSAGIFGSLGTSALSVSGNTTLNTLTTSGNTGIGSSLTVSSAAALNTLNVSGISSLTGNVGVGSSLNVAGLTYALGGLRVNGYSDLTGNVGIGNSLNVSSAALLDSLSVTKSISGATLGISGNVGIGASVNVVSAGIFGSLGTSTLSVSGNSTLSTLAVSGNTGIGSSLNVTSASILDSLSVTKSISGATLGISGNSNLATVYTSGNVGVGATSAAYNLDVWGTGRITGALTVGGNIGVGGTASFNSLVTSTGSFQGPNGSATAPAFSFTSDTDTGFYRPSANAMAFSAGGSDKLTITADGNVGIGLTNPVALLDLSSSSSSTSFQGFKLDWSPTTAITSTGDLFNIGIGSSGNVSNLFNITDSGSSVFSISETAFTTSLPANFTSPGDVSMAYDLNFTNPTASYIKSQAPLYIVSGEIFNSSDLTLQTYNSGNLLFDIGPGGYVQVGIGSSAPFNVYGQAIIGTGYVGVGITAPQNGLLVQGNVGIGNSLPSQLFQVNSGTSTTFINASGNLGIGATTSNNKLDVWGNARITGNLTVDGTSTYGGDLTVSGNILPSVNDTYDLGSNTARWRDLYLGPDTLHIGTSTSDEYTIAYDTTNNRLGFNVNGSGPSEITFNSDGNVGIGTTGPGYKLHVSDSASIGTFTGNQVQGIRVDGDGSEGSFALLGFGNYSTYTKNLAQVGGRFTSNGSYLYFGTSNNYDTGITNSAMVIDYSGNVGIGTTGPGTMLSVSGNGVFGFGGATSITGPSNGLGISGNLGVGTTSPNNKLQVIGAGVFGSDFGQYTAATNGLLVQGNVGIGATTSNNKLDVWGNARITGTLTVDSTLTNSSVFRAANGSAAAPAYSFTNLTDAGLWTNGDGLLLTTGGTNTSGITVTGAGNIGIGITNPAGALQVNGAVGIGYSSLPLSSFPTNGLAVSGNVGIGTTSPGALLHLSGANQTTADYGIKFGTDVTLYRSAASTLKTDGNFNAGGILLQPGSGRVYGANIVKGNIGEDLALTSEYGSITLGTGSYGGTNYNIVLSPAGGVGIGTSQPQAKLSIQGNVGIGYTGVNQAIPVNGLAVFGNVGIGVTTANSKLAVSGGQVLGTGYAGMIAPANGLLVQGLVGIGTTTPGNTLAVNGGLNLGTYASSTGPSNGLAISGNIGIGTTTANNALSVAGAINIGNALGITAPTNGALISGNVGIGGTSAGYNLDVWGTGRITNNLNVGGNVTGVGGLFGYSYGTGLASGANLAVSGNVGIGTTSPSRNLHIHGGTGDPGIQITEDSTGGTGGDGVQLQLSGAVSPNDSNFQVFQHENRDIEFYTNYSGGATSPRVVIDRNGNVGIGTTTANSNLSISGNAHIGSIRQGIAAPTDGLFVDGNVGIGATTSSNKLDVWGNARIAGTLTVDSTLTGSSVFRAANGTASLPAYSFTNLTNAGLWTNGDGLLLTTGGSNTSGITVTGAGNVGIGNTNPSETLQIGRLSTVVGINTYLAIHGGLSSNTGLKIKRYDGNYGFTIEDINALTGLNFIRHNNSAAGVSAMFISESTGNVGIGTTSPNSLLSVAGNAHIGSIRQGITAPTDGLFVDGNVGIGATTSSNKLDVWGNARIAGTLTVDSTIAPSGQFLAIDGSKSAPSYSFASSGNGDNGMYLPSSNALSFATAGNDVLTLTAGGLVGIGVTNPSYTVDISGNVRLQSQGFLSLSRNTIDNFRIYDNVANDLTIAAYTNNALVRDILTIKDSGNVGIGATTPVYKLDVWGDGRFTGNLTMGGSILPSADDVFDLGSNTARFRDLYLGPASLHIGTSTSDEYVMSYDTTNNRLGFNVNGSGPAEITFGSDGNVGIGTTSPTYPLEISSPLNISPLRAIVNNNLTNETVGTAVFDAVTSGVMADGYGPVITFRTRDGDAENNSIANVGGVRNGADNSGALVLGTSNAGSLTEKMRINNTGQVLINGTSSYGPTNTKFEVNNNTDVFAALTSWGGNASLVLQSTPQSTIGGDKTIVVNGDTLGQLQWKGADGAAFKIGAIIRAEVDGTPGTDDMPGRLVFATTPDGSNAATEQMRITSGGNVGIGFTSPAATLDVIGTTLLRGTAGTYGLAVTNAGLVGIGTTSPSGILEVFPAGAGRTAGVLRVVDNNVTVGVLSSTSGDNSNFNVVNRDGASLLYVEGDSNRVGIGATTPGYKLDVWGDGRFTGNLTMGGSILPSANDVFDLGSDTARWANVYVGPSTLHIGTSTSDEYTLAYDTTNNRLGFNVNGSGPAEIVMDSSGFVGIGTTAPVALLDVRGIANGGDVANVRIDSTSATYGGLAFYDAGTWRGSIGFGDANDYFSGVANDSLAVRAQTGDLALGSAFTTGQILFFTNAYNSERMRIDATGNVGLGTSSPLSLLSVAGGAHIGSIRQGISAPTDGLFVDGNVGIGATTSNNKLDVWGNARIAGTGTIDSTLSVAGITTLSASNGALSFTGSTASLTSGSSVFGLFAGGNVGIGTTGNLYGGLTVRGTGTGTNITLQTYGSGLGQGLTVLDNGNVGIGTTNPTQKLDVNGSMALTNTLYFGGRDDTFLEYYGTANLRMRGGGNDALLINSNGDVAIGALDPGTTKLYVNGNIGIGTTTANSNLSISGNAHIGSIRQGFAAPTDGLFVDGNVGIGATTSANKLDVWGNARISGTLTADSTTMLANALTVTSAGSVGIGITAPVQKFQINSSGTSAFVINSSGNVGIGFTSPTQKFQVGSGSQVLSFDSNLGSLGIGTITPGVIVSDTFTRADSATTLGSADTGQSWTAYDGTTWGISSNQAYKVSGGNNDPVAAIDSGISDGVVQVTVSTLPGNGHALIFRAEPLTVAQSNAQSYWSLRADDGRWILSKVVNTYTFTDYGTYNGAASGDVLKVVMQGSVIKAYVNGSLFATADDAFNQGATKHGLRAAYNSSAGRYDNFTVSKLNNLYVSGSGDINIDTANTIGLTIKGASSQTANLTEWKNSSRSILSVVDANGNLGIGTSVPWAKLSVQGNVGIGYTGANQAMPANGLAVSGNIGIGTTTANNALSVAGAINIGNALGITAPTNGALISGNVGIGATTSSNKLDVWGNARITGNLTVDGSLTSTASQFLAANGTAALPSYSFTNSPSTGLWSPSLNALSLTTNGSGTSGITVTAGGNVGIGTTAPLAKLQVAGRGMIGGNINVGPTADGLDVITSSGTIGFQVWDDNVLTKPRFIVERSGNVGISTSAPSSLFEVYGGQLKVRNTDGRFVQTGSTGFGLTAQTNDNSIQSQLSLTNTQISAIDNGSSLLFNLGYGGSSSVVGTAVAGSKIISASEQAWSSASSTQDAYMSFQTSLNGTLTEYMRINSNGNIGIGTSSPLSKLSVAGGAHIGSIRQGISAPTDGLFVDGNVGIGATTSSNKLDVWGDSRISGTLTADGITSLANTLTALPSTGFVGIGTTSPSVALSFGTQFESMAGTSNALRLYDDGATNTSTSNNSYGFGVKDGNQISYTAGTGGAHRFYTANTERLVVTSTGNVGIGFTSPDRKFQVGTDIDITGTAASILGANGAQFSITGLGAGTTHKKLTLGVDTTDNYGIIQAGNTDGTAYNLNLNPGGGNVGIGTTSPGQILAAYTSSGNAYLEIGRATQSQGSVGTYIKGGAGGKNWSLYQPGSSDDLRFHDGTTDRFTFQNGGNLGIGTASPVAQLDVRNTNTSTGLHTYIGSSAGQFSILDNGNVGIGTTSPSDILDIVSEVYPAKHLRLGGYNAEGPTSNFAIDFYRSRGSYGSPAGLVNNYILGEINSYGYSGSEYVQSAQIRLQTEGTIAANRIPGAITFSTHPDSTSALAERMRIDSAGNIGIGFTSPAATLDVIGTTFLRGSLGTYGLAVTNAGLVGIGITNPVQAFQVNPSASNPVVITSGGNLGIGNTSPAYNLDVTGTGKLSQGLTIAGTLPLPTGTAVISDTFTRSDGSLGTSETGQSWTGSTYTVSSNTAINTPTLGSELLTNSTFDTDLTGWSLTTGNGTIAWNSGAIKFTQGASSWMYASQQITSTTGTWYKAQVDLTARTGSYPALHLSMGTTQNGSQLGQTSSLSAGTTGTVIFRATGTSTWFNIKDGANTNETSTWDNATLKALTLSSLFASLEHYVTNNLTIQADATVATSAQAGVVLNLDSASDPQNFVIAYHNGTNAVLEKVVGGTYTTLISSSAAYSAGATIKVVKTGTSYDLYYNDSQVGTTQTISDSGIASNTLYGLFSTDSGSTLDNFNVSTTPLLTVGSGNLFQVNSLGYAYLPGGAAQNPALSFVGDINTGIFSSGADTLNFATGGSERFRIDSNGNVGIGTSQPNAKLSIQGSVGIGYTGVNQSIPVNGLAILGNIGIGTTTANSSLSIAGNAHIGNIRQGISAPTDGLFVDGNVGIGTTTSSNKLDVWGNSRLAGTLTADSNTSLANTLTALSSTGLVGIGTTAPLHKLDVVNSNNQIHFSATAADSGGYLFSTGATQAILAGGAVYDGAWRAKATQASYIQADSATLQFYTNDSLTAGSTFTPTERMRITSGGNVGIGWTTPGALLDIGGSTASLRFTETGAGGRVWEVGSGVATNGFLTFYDVSYPNESVLTLDTSRRIGVRDTSPNAVFEVSGDGDETNDLFMVSSSNTLNGNRFIIKNGGNVGIGFTSPADLLYLKVDNGEGITLHNGTNTILNTQNNAGDGYLSLYQEGSDVIRFNAKANTSSYFNAGNLGIGFTSPAATLDVIGTTLLRGSLGTYGLAVTNQGYAGIGTTAPSGILEVFAPGAGRTAGQLRIVDKNVTIGQLSGTSSDNTTFQVVNRLNNVALSVVSETQSAVIGGTTTLDSSAKLVIVGANNEAVANALIVGDENDNTYLQISSTGVGDTDKGRIYIAGSLGIGTTIPQARLSIQGNVGIGYTGANQAIPVNGLAVSGNVGIGTTTANSLLSVAGGAHIGGAYQSISAPTNGLFVDGNVGIGATTSSNKLDVWGNARIAGTLTVDSTLTNSSVFRAANGSASAPAYSFTNLTDAGLWTNGDGLLLTTSGSNTSGITVTGAGLVGIGTTTPAGSLHVRSTTNTLLGRFVNTGKTVAQVDLAADSASLALYALDSTYTTSGALTADSVLVYTENASGGLNFVNTTGKIGFYAGGSAATNEAMRITSTGNVGIGTSNPLTLLHLRGGNSGGSVHSYSKFTLENSDHFGMQFLTPSTKTAYIMFGDADDDYVGGIEYNHATDSMIFQINDADKVVIDSNGNLGIGFTSPAATLDVIGTTLLRGTAGTYGLAVGSNGNVGIGTTAPVAPLQISATQATNRGQLSIGSPTTNTFMTWYEGSTYQAYIQYNGGDFNIQNYSNGSYGDLILNPSGGNVGIGFTSPAATLDVIGTSLLRGTGGTYGLAVTNNGYVGIGITSPSYKLSISDGTDQIGVYPDGTNAQMKWTDGDLYLMSDEGDSNADSIVFIRGKANGVGKLYIEGPDDNGDRLSLVGENTYSEIQSLNNELRITTGANNADILLTPNGTGDVLVTAGNLGIGFTSPAATLDVIGTSMLRGSLGKYGLTVTNAGRVGIGTTAPNTLLQIGDGNGTQEMRIYGASGRYMRLFTDGDGNIDVPVGQLLIATHDNDISLSSGNNIRIAAAAGKSTQFTGNVGIGNTNPQGLFEVGNAATPALYIASPTGNVGIGTTSPNTKLHVTNSAAASINGQEALRLSATHTAATIGSGAILQFADTDGTTLGPFIRSYTTGSGAVGMAFGTGWNPAAINMFLSSNGNVGIGTTSPGAKLAFAAATTAAGGIDFGGDVNLYRAGANTLVTDDNFDNRGGGHTITSYAFYSDAGLSKTGGVVGTFTIDPGSGDLALTTDSNTNLNAGSGQFFIQGSDGNVGIGFTSPAAKLDVHGTTLLRGSLGVNGLAVTNAGMVGIGTTAPVSQLELSSSSTSTAFQGLKLSWLPTASTTLAGDLVNIGIGSSGNAANLLNITDSGSSIFSISETALTTSLPVNFTSPGDVAIAYDINMTNPTASYIKSQAPLYLTAGEVFNSSDLTLQTFNSGNINFDPGPGGLVRVGIGSTAPFELNGQMIIGKDYVGIGRTAPQNGMIIQGNVGIGTSSPTAPLEVRATGTGTIAKFTSNNTTGCTLADGGTISCSSDINFKKNIDSINYGLDTIVNLHPVVYNWKTEKEGTSKSLGFIAQEVESVIPKLVTTDENGYKQLNTIGLVPVLTKAIQEQQSQLSAISLQLSNLNISEDGTLNVPSLKTDSIVLDPSLTLTANTLSTMEDTLNTKIASLEERIAALEERKAILESPLQATESASIATPSAEIATDSAQIATDSAQSTSGESEPTPEVSDGLDLTPPDILYATGSAQLANLTVHSEATFSGQLTAYDLDIQNSLKALGKTTLGDTTIAGTVTIDGTLSIDNGSEINVMGTLYLQKSYLAGALDILNGAFVFNPDGTLEVSGTVLASEIAVKAGTTAGVGTITAGQIDIIIENEYVDENSIILITPRTPLAQTLAVTAKTAGGFLVELAQSESVDITFDYLIVGVK